MPAVFYRFSPWMVLVGSLIGYALGASAADRVYSNPLTDPSAGADPAVLYHEGTYYTYTTNSEGRVYLSQDLVHWSAGPKVLPAHLKGAWAPEVYFHPEDGKFYMYYTYRYKIGVAVADRPDELFVDLGFLAIPGIDAHVFRDDDGRLYLYFTHTPAFSMYCIPLRTPTEPCGPVTQCFEVSQDWELNGHPVNEGPWMLKRDGTYYLFYSGSSAQTKYYSIGYATAPTPLGPFTKNPQNPVFRRSDGVFGPGHGSFERDRAGQWWHLYHQKTSAEPGWERYVCLDPVVIDDVTGEISSVPTLHQSQTAPVFNADLTWAPDIWPRGSYFYSSEKVSLSSRTPGAEIRYTFDGSDPDRDSPLFEQPFEISKSVNVKARAFKSGMTESRVSSMRFTRTNWKLAPTPMTTHPSGDPPFRVYPSPNLVAPPPLK